MIAPQRSYGENENLTLAETDLRTIGEPRPTAGGRKLRAYCPIHGSDHQQSLEVSLDTGRFYCHACSAWGYMDWAREEYAHKRSLKRDSIASTAALGSDSRKSFTRRRPPEAPQLPEPARADLDDLMRRFREALPGSWGEKYLRHRGVSLEVAHEYGVGYAGGGRWPHRGRDWRWGRIVAPHSRPDGVMISLYGRAVGSAEKVPKQMRHDHLPGSKGYFNTRALASGEGPVYVCEGVFDALALIASGCERTVAIFSARDWRWHWLPENVRQLVLAFDADVTGDEAREDIAAGARLRGIEVAYLDADGYGGENDPAEAYAAGKLVVGKWPAQQAPAAALEPTLKAAPDEAASTNAEAAPEESVAAAAGESEAADGEALRFLHRIYSEGGCVELHSGSHLYAGKPGGLAEADRRALRLHGEELKRLLSEEAMSVLWGRAMRHILDSAARSGHDYESPEYRRATELIEAAQEAYEQEKNGLCRHLLWRAALAAAGRSMEAYTTWVGD